MLKKVVFMIDETVLQQNILCGESTLSDDLRKHGVRISIERRSDEDKNIHSEKDKAARDDIEYGMAQDGEADRSGAGTDGSLPYDGSGHGGMESSGDTLYVTDSEAIYHSLRQQGGYVLPYRHAGNPDADFTGARYVIEQIGEADYEALDLAYRRLTGLPWEILRTKRCIIRETTEADVDSFYQIYARKEITRYMEELYEDRAEELAYIKAYREEMYGFYGYGMWTVLLQDGTVIGRAGISWRAGFDVPELGFVIGVPWQRQGYAYEVCSAILDYAREELGFTQMQALVMAANEPSAALCRKLGFTPTGTVATEREEYVVYQYLCTE